jgi:hypothetical protein
VLASTRVWPVVHLPQVDGHPQAGDDSAEVAGDGLLTGKQAERSTRATMSRI